MENMDLPCDTAQAFLRIWGQGGTHCVVKHVLSQEGGQLVRLVEAAPKQGEETWGAELECEVE